MQTVTASPEETAALGRSFGARLRPGDVVALYGTLGTGKTCFVQGVCEALGVRSRVGSPTFTLINEYPSPAGAVVHIDLYRIGARAELSQLGLEEYLGGPFICLVEWPELASGLLPAGTRAVRIRHGASARERVITIEEDGA